VTTDRGRYAGQTVVAVGAHPDDVEVGMGGTVARLARGGAQVVIVALCSPADPETRAAEARQAASILGADCRLAFDQAACRIEDIKSYELVQRLDALVKELEPVALFSHGRSDHHRDHLLTFEACRAVQRLRFMDFYCYYPAACRPTPVNFSAQAYVDITETVEDKLLAIAAHRSQFEQRGLDLGFQRDLARYYGRLSGTTYAEAHEIIHCRLG
jgi:LmbE family N-acetylglucosaminyl deacetylase